MRRLLFLVICVAIVASNASAGPTGTTARYTCGAKKMTFYFWPQGHHAVPSLRFSEFTTPHLEAYTSAGSFKAFVDANGSAELRPGVQVSSADLPARWTGDAEDDHDDAHRQLLIPRGRRPEGEQGRRGRLLIATIGHTAKLAGWPPSGRPDRGSPSTTRYCRTSPARRRLSR